MQSWPNLLRDTARVAVRRHAHAERRLRARLHELTDIDKFNQSNQTRFTRLI